MIKPMVLIVAVIAAQNTMKTRPAILTMSNMSRLPFKAPRKDMASGQKVDDTLITITKID